MDCHAAEPFSVKGAVDNFETKVQVIPPGKGIGKFIKGLKSGIRGLAESAGIPAANPQHVKDVGDAPAIEPSDLADVSIKQECAGTIYYVSKRPITASISDRKCWKKLSLQACPPGKELVQLKGALQCISRRVLREEGNRNVECFE